MHRNDDKEEVRRRLKQRGYEIFRTRDACGEERAPHRHDFYEVDLVWSGSTRYQTGGSSYHLTNGDILLIRPGERHWPVPEGEQSSCERVVLWLDRSFLQKLRSPDCDPAECFDTPLPGGGSCLRFDDEATWRIGELMERCLRENGSGDFGSVILADAIMTQVVILLNRLYRKALQSRQRGRSGALVSGVIDYINGHFAEELTLDTLASHFFISKFHLSREFARIVGTTVHRYITQKRLVVAKQMLSEGRPSSMVYQHCGFGDYSNFYRAFRGEYGISPKAYAAALREESARNAEQVGTAANAEPSR